MYNVRMYVRMYVCMYVCLYVMCTYVCMHVCMTLPISAVALVTIHGTFAWQIHTCIIIYILISIKRPSLQLHTGPSRGEIHSYISYIILIQQVECSYVRMYTCTNWRNWSKTKWSNGLALYSMSVHSVQK